MLGFTPAETASLFSYFDVDGSETIDYNEFLRAIRGPMSQKRTRKQ
jgi:Ca2+-binding EF-hand superfamily protein